MFLYHYMNPQYVLETILKNRIKISTMDSLNDPYEMLPDFADPTGEQVPAYSVRMDMQKKILKDTGIFCMSSTISSPVMWAHYADKHKGVAFQFEFSASQAAGFNRVDYTDKRVVIEPSDDLKDDTVFASIQKRMIETKAVCWCCEQEYRWVLNLDNEKVFVNKQGLYFRHLPEEWTSVILGVDCKLSEGLVRKALDQKGFTDVNIGKAKLSDTGFEIEVV